MKKLMLIFLLCAGAGLNLLASPVQEGNENDSKVAVTRIDLKKAKSVLKLNRFEKLKLSGTSCSKKNLKGRLSVVSLPKLVVSPRVLDPSGVGRGNKPIEPPLKPLSDTGGKLKNALGSGSNKTTSNRPTVKTRSNLVEKISDGVISGDNQVVRDPQPVKPGNHPLGGGGISSLDEVIKGKGNGKDTSPF